LTGLLSQLYDGFKRAFWVKSDFTKVKKQADEIPAALNTIHMTII